MDNWIIILVLSCVLITVLVIFINYRRTQKTMDTIEQMLDAAADGTYSESNFDESRLSALETKFAHYSSASLISAQNVTAEKDKIKTLITELHPYNVPEIIALPIVECSKEYLQWLVHETKQQ